MTTDPRFAYRENAARLSSPVGRVVLLYEQAIQDLGAAVTAVAAGDIERRTQQIGHALLVIGQLQGSLDLDRGGEVARNLDRFYTLSRRRLLEAQISGSGKILDEQRALLLSLRAAWIEVEKAEKQNTPVQKAGAPATDASQSTPTHWRA